MEKLDLQVFRNLKQEVIEMIAKFEEDLSEEEEQGYINRYEEIINTLSEHDLSDIDFEEWKGMLLDNNEDRPIDFSKTKANLDFSIIDYSTYHSFPNFKGCQIKNFDFKKLEYSPEMFDEEFRKENKGSFLSDNVPQDIADKFYKGELSLLDIKNNTELANKIEEKNLSYCFRTIYRLIGREEFCKLDAEFIDEIKHKNYEELIENNTNLRTAKEIMPYLYNIAREKIIGYMYNADSANPFDSWKYIRQDELGEGFKKSNPDLFLSDDAPQKVKESYYNHSLTLAAFSDNLQYFEGKTVAQSFGSNGIKFAKLYGEDIYNLFKNHKPIMDMIIKDWFTLNSIEVPNGPVTEEQRKEIMANAFLTYFIRNGSEKIENWQQVKMLQDFINLENIPLSTIGEIIIKKYDLDTLIESGLEFKYFVAREGLTNLKEITNIHGIQQEDLRRFIGRQYNNVLKKYDIKQLLDYGINDLSELSEPINDLHQLKEKLDKIPIELINVGRNDIEQKEFIQKYGIDNILKLDEETNGMFSHKLWDSNMYLTLFTTAEMNAPKLDIKNKQLTYKEFKNRMYEILLHARDERGPLRSGDYPDYDFIKGEFRAEHPEIFIDGDIDLEIKRKFYTGKMNAADVRDNPILVQLLQGKDLSRVFSMNMIAGISMQMLDKDGNTIGGIPNTVNMAQYLSRELGQAEFLKLCMDYGSCLDNSTVKSGNKISSENIRDSIEQAIYKRIKEKGISYFEDLPKSFKEKHPDLFLPKEINEDIRNRFYNGKLSFEDIRKNPELKQILPTKDLNVGFRVLRHKGQVIKLTPNGQVLPTTAIWQKLSIQEIMNLAETYGGYLEDVKDDVFNEEQIKEEREKSIQDDIEYNILTRKSLYGENVPDFFKQRHPNMFLDENAPEKLKLKFYDTEITSYPGFQNNNGYIDFEMIKENAEWKEFLKGKDLSRAFSKEYDQIFKIFDSNTIMKLGTKYTEAVKQMVQNHREETLENWYKSTGGKFVPYHIVMLNYPEGEIDNFLGNIKKWSQLMRIDNYNLNDDGKAAILKAAYSMGVFQGNDDGFNKVMKLFTDIPQELTQDEYNMVAEKLSMVGSVSDDWEIDEYKNEDITLFKDSYKLNDSGKYILNIDKQKNKESVKKLREYLEATGLQRILTPAKAHQMFDSFAMKYNPNFVKFFYENVEEILSDSEYTKDIATIQRQFDDIVRTNAGRRLTLGIAQDYIKSIAYTDIEVGNEGVAEQAKIAGYSQKDFEAIQRLFNEGEVRDFSSIPRIKGELNGYKYEILRCDDPLALTIGTLTDCCQEIHGAGQTSMEHSVVSPDGRVFCVKDNEGRLVAQSWFWRNQYTGCFDNIEIPHRIFELYEKNDPDAGRKQLTTDVLEVYKKAAQDLMQEDEKVYTELLENGTISEEQYDSLLLGKITIGLGYNDIAEAIRKDETIHRENDIIHVKGTERLPHPYTDASTQYTIAERDGIVKSQHQNLYVHQDDIPVYDETNMSSTVLLTMKRMEQSTERDNLAYINETKDENNLTKSQKLIKGIAREYGFDPETTKVMATSRMAIIYSKDDDNNVKIGDLLSSPIKEDLPEEKKKIAQTHITHQIKKALRQMEIENSEVDVSILTEEQKQMLELAMQEIEKEKGERGER